MTRDLINFDIYPSLVCNKGCQYCYMNETKCPGLLDLSVVDESLHQVSETYKDSILKVFLLGGEPLMLPVSYLNKLLYICRKYTDVIAIATNLSYYKKFSDIDDASELIMTSSMDNIIHICESGKDKFDDWVRIVEENNLHPNHPIHFGMGTSYIKELFYTTRVIDAYAANITHIDVEMFHGKFRREDLDYLNKYKQSLIDTIPKINQLISIYKKKSKEHDRILSNACFMGENEYLRHVYTTALLPDGKFLIGDVNVYNMLEDDTIQYFDNAVDVLKYFSSIFDIFKSKDGGRHTCPECQFFNRCVVNHVSRRFSDVSECDIYQTFLMYMKPVDHDPFINKSWIWFIP